MGKLEWKFITSWNCTPTRFVPLLKNLWSKSWDLREVVEGGCSCEFKSLCQRKPCLNYCLRQFALQRRGSAKVVETLKQSASSHRNTQVFLLLSEKKSYGETGKKYFVSARLFKFWSKNRKKMFDLEPQAGCVLWQWRWNFTHSFLCIRFARRIVRVYVGRSRIYEIEKRVCKVDDNRNITPWSPKQM
jgi:hypothetical protein